MTVPLPTASTRWRCTLCGNLTRFDVTRSSKRVRLPQRVQRHRVEAVGRGTVIAVSYTHLTLPTICSV